MYIIFQTKPFQHENLHLAASLLLGYVINPTSDKLGPTFVRLRQKRLCD